MFTIIIYNIVDMQSHEDGNRDRSDSLVKAVEPKFTVLKASMENGEVNRNLEINWFYMLGLGACHVLAFFGVINILQGRVLTSTIIFALVLAELGCLGITIGAHRLWSHRSFKANLALKILLMTCQTLSGQETVWNWAIWHRVHHKYVDTDADPHNSTRGFFYSHIGWILTFDHEKFRSYGLKVDMSDLMKDPVVMWQKRYIRAMELFIVAFAMPAIFLWLCFNESLVNAFCVGTGLRVTYVMHRVFLINSAAHMWGVRPYDQKIYPTENKLVSMVICGEGWHNYHHSFPHDYKAAELGLYRWNLSAAIIDFFAWIGWAYDLRTASPEAVKSRVERTGDQILYESQTFG